LPRPLRQVGTLTSRPPIHESATQTLVIPTRERSETGGICFPTTLEHLTPRETLCRLTSMGRSEPRLTAQTLKALAVLTARAGNEMSGADIARVTKIASGSLYPILLRLEQAQWAESRWEAEDPRDLGRPRRRLYRITGLGARKVKSAIRELVLPLKELAWL